MDNIMALIGGGATALAFLHHFINRFDMAAATPCTVYVFEKSRAFGPGAAYVPDSLTNILNTRTAYITAFDDRPGDFLHWLESQEAVWRAAFPHFEIDPQSYAPRPLFGLYLQDRMAWLIGTAAMKGIRIVQIRAEVCDVEKTGAGYMIKTVSDLALRVRHIFLLCGTLPERKPTAQHHSTRVLSHPYPISNLRRLIPPAAKVAVIGARLSCIDAVIGLLESGHYGHIAIYSRSGYFPSVRGTQGRIVPKYLTADSIKTLLAAKASLDIDDFVLLVRQEIAHVAGIDLADVPDLSEPPLPPACLKDYLRQEIGEARHDRPWQAVLYSTNAIIEQLWQALGVDQRAILLEKYMSPFMAYRVSIPVENAKKILGYLEQGKISFHAGRVSLDLGEDGRPQLVSRNSSPACRRYDYIINAKGSPRDIADIDSPLLQKLLERGYISAHELGGIRFDAASYEVIDARGLRNPSLRVVGELTTGEFFFTSALDINVRHARQCVEAFMATQRQLQHSLDASLRLARHGELAEFEPVSVS